MNEATADENTKELEEELVTALRKEMIAGEIYSKAKERVKLLMQLIHEELVKQKREVAMPLLQEMINGFDDGEQNK